MPDSTQTKRPQLAVSAAIAKEGRLLVVRRAAAPALGLFSFPGGRVEWGETLHEAVRREIVEETGLTIDPVGLAGIREAMIRSPGATIEGHFVILCYAARLVSGSIRLNWELDETRWVTLDELIALPVTEGLADIAEAALSILAGEGPNP